MTIETLQIFLEKNGVTGELRQGGNRIRAPLTSEAMDALGVGNVTELKDLYFKLAEVHVVIFAGGDPEGLESREPYF